MIDIQKYFFEYHKDFKILNPKPIINKDVINDNNINGPSLIKVPDFVENKLEECSAQQSPR